MFTQIFLLENNRVQVKFKVSTIYGEYSDAFYFEASEYNALSEEELNYKIETRVDAWIYAINNPEPIPEGESDVNEILP